MGIEGMKWNEGEELVYLCTCDSQEYYECGGMGRKNCPYAKLVRRADIPNNAFGPGALDEYWSEEG